MCLGYFLILLDVTVVNVALPAISSTFAVTGPPLAWTVDAYAIPLGALLLAAGSIGDRLGHRQIVCVGLLGVTLASVACALAPTFAVLVVARLVQGIAAGLMLPGTLALLTNAFPDPTARSRAVAIWAAIGGAALPAGPLLGGILVNLFGVRSVFWLSVPLGLLALLGVMRTAPRTAPNRGQAVDLWGAVLSAAALGAFIAAVIEWERSSLLSAGLLLVALVSLVLFWVHERRHPDPMLSSAVIRRGRLMVPVLVAGVMNLCTLGILFVLTQALQSIHGLSALASGGAVLFLFIPTPLAAPLASRMVRWIGALPTAAIGAVIGAIGFIVLAITDLSFGPVLAIGLVLWGLGIGILVVGVVDAAMAALPDRSGTASGLSNTARQVGGAVGVAICAALAGSTASPSTFLSHTDLLLITSAVLFVIAALACIGVQRRVLSRPSHTAPENTQSPDTGVNTVHEGH